MPGTLGTCSYGSLNIRRASMSFSRGVTPSIACLQCTPVDNLDLSPGPLTFEYGSTQVQFQDAAVMGAFIRPRRTGRGWLMSVQVVDRRWKWAFGSIFGEYNRRTPSGFVDNTNPNNQKTPSQLADLCFQALGEGGANTSQMPQGVFPYVNWQNVNPALALADLCEKVACDVVLNHLTNAFEIWPLGTGPGTLTGFGELHQKYRFTPRNIPSTIEAHGGDSLFQTKLRIRAVGQESDGTQKLVDNLTWKPLAGWAGQGLHFPGVGAGNQASALDQIWRDFRVTGQFDGSLGVPQCQATISSTDQYLLEDYLIDPAEKSLDGYYKPLPFLVEGNFWPYADTPASQTNIRQFAGYELDKKRQVVKFARPVIALGSSGIIAEPTLYLTTAYRVRTVDGTTVRLVRSGSTGVSGSGKLVLRRPEVRASYKVSYSSSDGSPAGTSHNESQATQELDRYVQIFQQKYSNPTASELTYPGIIAGTLNGIVAQCRWSVGTNRHPLTMACENEELDVTAVPRTERRRREILRQIAEALG